MLKVLDLFSGIGGFSLGLERTGGFETVAFCEIDKFAQKVLKKHWPDVPIIEDIRSFDGPPADVICGGFPCQPFSTASRGRRVAVDLWPQMERVIRESSPKPKYVIGENVQFGPINSARNALKRIGYRVTIKNIPASYAGADHQRMRWWLVAHPHNESEFRRILDAKVEMLPKLCENLWGWENFGRTLRVSYGLSNRMDRNRINRLKCLGNAVIPQIPEMIGYAILEAEA